MYIKTSKLQNSILPGELAPDLDDLYSSYVRELQEDADLPSLLDLIKMFKFCPINRTAVELKALRAVASFGDYLNSDRTLVITATGKQTVEDWVLSNFVTMRGSFASAMSKMFRQCYALGYSVAEIVYSPNMPGHKGEWRIAKIKVLNPFRYRFAGYDGDWDRIIYRSSYKSHFPIPRSKLIHIYMPSLEDPENPLGDGQGVRGYTYYLARKLAYRNWNNQLASGYKGLTVVKADSNSTVPKTDSTGTLLLDAQGRPMATSAVHEAGKAFRNAKEGDTVAVDKSTEVQHFPGITGTGQDYNLAVGRYADDILMGYGIPKTILSEGSATLGQAGLGSQHIITLDMQINSMVDVAREQVLEQIIKPLLLANFGAKYQDDYGEFKTEEKVSIADAGLRISNLMSAVYQDAISLQELQVINRLRTDLGLSPLTPEQHEEIIMQQFQAKQASYEAEQVASSK